MITTIKNKFIEDIDVTGLHIALIVASWIATDSLFALGSTGHAWVWLVGTVAAIINFVLYLTDAKAKLENIVEKA